MTGGHLKFGLRSVAAALLFSLLLSPGLSAEQSHEAINVLFGVIEVSADGSRRLTSATRIPLRTRESGFEFGVLLKSSQPVFVSGYVEYRLPGAASATTGNVVAVNPQRTRVRQPIVMDSSVWLGNLFFHPDDPTGRWMVEVIIEGERVFQQPFEVYLPAADQQ